MKLHTTINKKRAVKSDSPITVTFVIPVYNEELRLEKTFEALRSFKAPRGLKLQEVIFVNDGSTDKSEFKISNLKFKIEKKLGTKIMIISYKPNRGKGYAIKKGMLASSSDYTLFFDADMSTPLSELEKFVPFMKKQTDVIVGTRKNGHSTVIKHQPFIREKLGKCFTLLTQVTLNTWVTDFTCGFKAFSKDATNEIFSKAQIDRWGYDAEIIFLARILNFSIQEKAVTWANDDRSKVSLTRAIPQTLGELMRIRYMHSMLPLLASLRPNSGVAARQTVVE